MEPVTLRNPHFPGRPTRLPDEELRSVYEEVVATGSQRAVAKARGWNQAKVRHRVLSWMDRAGIMGDPPGIISPAHRQRASLSHSGQGDRSAWKRAVERTAELEAENAALRARTAAMEAAASPFVRIHARLDAIERAIAHRPAVTHRRVIDGGIGGRRERRVA